MPFAIVFAPETLEDLGRLTANGRATVRTALETRLGRRSEKTSRSRIKRLRGLRRPQYRLRAGEVRVFYDVSGATVEVLAVVAKSAAEVMARAVRKSEMKEVPLSEIKDDLSCYFREAEAQEIVITRHGKPAGVLIGFESARRTGSITASNMTRASCVASNGHEAACALDVVSGSKTSKRNSDACHVSSGSAPGWAAIE